ncbi:DUF1127 domain-containing protein [Pseudomonas akapageensis]|uniref:DUF1127 domain-containing protein n=1 Tax=Pseudomonas akapageensis TaxID=2609961 RepID=UPI00140AD91E|nr:DUF1127 domain-containing protein [Pseudomonas akapageensis]
MDRLAPAIESSKPQAFFLKGLLQALSTRIALMFERARTRQQLAELSDQQLADIGISRSDRVAELDRPFWR